MFRHQLTILHKAIWTSFGVAVFLAAGSVSLQAASIQSLSFTFGDGSTQGFPETIVPVTETESVARVTDSSFLNVTNAPTINASTYNGATIIANTTLKVGDNYTLNKKINTADGVNVTLEGVDGKSVTIKDTSFAENSNVTLGGSSNYYVSNGSKINGNLTVGENASFEIGSASQTSGNNPSNIVIRKLPLPTVAYAASTTPASFQTGYSAQDDNTVLNQVGVIDVNGNVRIDGRLVVNIKDGQVDVINVEGEIGLGENFKFVVMVDSYEDYAGMVNANILNGEFDEETMEMLESMMEKGELQSHLESEVDGIRLMLSPEGVLGLNDAAMVPEPATWAMLFLGLLGIGYLRKRK
ncbi:MAG: PEP-CTERM sorting domain-containing protein [Thermoguttaceae bacterium]|nr:PEP-CTERM sorting domain-containing protein [Thermoguttaceae bacterium]